MDVFQRINQMYQMNFAKIEKQIMAYYLGEPKMIKLSNGVEVSEETVVNALKKAGISVEPKHVWKPGDVAYVKGNSADWRLIVRVEGKLVSINQFGGVGAHSLKFFDLNGYKYAGKVDNVLVKK